MGSIYIANAFSLQMLDDGAHTVRVVDTTPAEVAKAVGSCSECVRYAVGHRDTAAMAARSLLDADPALPVTAERMFSRENLTIASGDVLYVIQLIGGRLPENCTELPPGIKMRWKKVTLAD